MVYKVRFLSLSFGGLLALATGCSDSDHPHYGRLLVQKPDLGAMSGQGEGVIEIDDGGCVYLVLDNEKRLSMVWPSGTTFDSDAQAVVLESGLAVHDGDFVQLGGGADFSEGIRPLIEPASLTAESEACLMRSTPPKISGERDVFIVGMDWVEILD